MVAPAVACTGRGVLTEVGPLVDNMEPVQRYFREGSHVSGASEKVGPSSWE